MSRLPRFLFLKFFVCHDDAESESRFFSFFLFFFFLRTKSRFLNKERGRRRTGSRRFNAPFNVHVLTKSN